MSLIASLGAIEIGLIFGLVALGVYLSFRVINFPDLTVDGSFPLGGAVCAILISTGTNPWLATLAACSTVFRKERPGTSASVWTITSSCSMRCCPGTAWQTTA